MSGAFLGFESLGFFAAVVGIIALAGVGGFSGFLLLEGRFKIHTVGRHGDLVCAILIKSNLAASGSLHAASFAQLIAIGSGKGSNNLSPNCGTNNAFSRVLNGNLNRTTFGRFHISGNAILNDRKLWGDSYIVSRHCESIGVGFLAGLIRNNSILAVFNRQTVFSQLGQHRIVIHRLNSQSNSFASFHVSGLVSRHLAVFGAVGRNAVGFNLNRLKRSANGNIGSGHLEGCFAIGQGQLFGLFIFADLIAVGQAVSLELVVISCLNGNGNVGALNSCGRVYGNSAVLSRSCGNLVFLNKLCADVDRVSRHCKGVGVGFFGISLHFNGLLGVVSVFVGNLHAASLQGIAGRGLSSQGYGFLLSCFFSGSSDLTIGQGSNIDRIGLGVFGNADGHIAVRHGEGVNRLSLFGGSLGCGFVLRCFLNFSQGNIGIAVLCGNGNDIGAFLFYGQGNGIVLDVGVVGGAQGQGNALNCIGQGNSVGGAFGCGMAIRAQVHIVANGLGFQLVQLPGMALGQCAVSVLLFTLGQAVLGGAVLGVSGGIAPCFNGNIGGCAAAQVADHAGHRHGFNQVSAPHELFVLVLLVRAAHVLVVTRVVVPGLGLVALAVCIRSAGGIGLDFCLAVHQFLIGVGQVGADRNDQLILGGVDAGDHSLALLGGGSKAVAVTQGQARQRMVLEGAQILHTAGIIGAIHDNHAHAGKVGIGNHVAVLILGQLNAAIDGVVFLHFFHCAGGRVHTVDGVVDVEVQLAIIQCGRVYQCGVDPLCSSVCQALGVQVVFNLGMLIYCTGIDLIDGASFGQNLGIAVVIIEVAAGFLQIVVVHQDDIKRVIRLGKAAHAEAAGSAAGILFADIVVRITRTCFQSIGALALHLLHELLHLGVVTRAAGTRAAVVAVLGLLAAHVVIQVLVGRGINVIEVIIVEVDGAADRGEPGILVAGIGVTGLVLVIRLGVRVMRLAVVQHNIAVFIHIGILVLGVGVAIVQRVNVIIVLAVTAFQTGGRNQEVDMAQVACVLNAGLGHALGVHVVIADVNIVPVLVGFAGGHRSRVAVALQLVDLDCVKVVDVVEHAAAERITGNTGIRSIAVIQDLGKVNNSVIAYFIGGLPAAVIILIDALVVRQILDHVVKCSCIAQADAAILNALSADLAAQQGTESSRLDGVVVAAAGDIAHGAHIEFCNLGDPVVQDQQLGDIVSVTQLGNLCQACITDGFQSFAIVHDVRHERLRQHVQHECHGGRRDIIVRINAAQYLDCAHGAGDAAILALLLNALGGPERSSHAEVLCFVLVELRQLEVVVVHLRSRDIVSIGDLVALVVHIHGSLLAVVQQQAVLALVVAALIGEVHLACVNRVVLHIVPVAAIHCGHQGNAGAAGGGIQGRGAAHVDVDGIVILVYHNADRHGHYRLGFDFFAADSALEGDTGAFPVNGNGSAGRNFAGFAVIEQLGVAVVIGQLALDLLHFPVEGSNKVAICILGHGMVLAGQGGNVVGAGGGFLVFLLNRALVSGHAGRVNGLAGNAGLCIGGILGYGAFYLLVGIVLFTGIHSGVSPAVIGLGPVAVGGLFPLMGVAILRVGVIPVPFRLAIGMAVCSGAGRKGIGVFSNVSLCVAVSLLRNHFIIAVGHGLHRRGHAGAAGKGNGGHNACGVRLIAQVGNGAGQMIRFDGGSHHRCHLVLVQAIGFGVDLAGCGVGVHGIGQCIFQRCKAHARLALCSRFQLGIVLLQFMHFALGSQRLGCLLDQVCGAGELGQGLHSAGRACCASCNRLRYRRINLGSFGCCGKRHALGNHGCCQHGCTKTLKVFLHSFILP